jgi:hypothetical protein
MEYAPSNVGAAGKVPPSLRASTQMPLSSSPVSPVTVPEMVAADAVPVQAARSPATAIVPTQDGLVNRVVTAARIRAPPRGIPNPRRFVIARHAGAGPRVSHRSGVLGKGELARVAQGHLLDNRYGVG